MVSISAITDEPDPGSTWVAKGVTLRFGTSQLSSVPLNVWSPPIWWPISWAT